jgi:hypothetical protein
MAVITTGAHPKALWPGIKKWFGTIYDQWPDEYPKLFDEDTSDKAYEEDVETKPFGLAPIKTEGGGISYDADSQGYVARYTHVAYALGYIVTYEELQDNKYEVVGKRRAEKLARAMKQTLENVAANVYNRAHSSSYTGGDASALCVTNHTTETGSQSNTLSTAADLSEASLEDMCVQIMGATDTRGNKIAIMPQSLVVPRQEWFNANRILRSTLQNDSANNAVNVLKATNALPGGIILNHYLTDSDAVFVRTNAPRSLIHYERQAVTFDQDNDFDTKNARSAAYMRHSFGWSDFRGLYSNGGGA